jgi:hypothetical protein
MDSRRIVHGDARPEAQAALRALADAQRPATTYAADCWAGHKPGFATPTADQLRRRNEAYNAYVQRLTTAWKMDARRVEPDPDEDDDNGDDNDVESARDAYVRRLTNAWRTPGRVDAGYRNAVRRPEKMVIGAGPGVVGPGPNIVGVGPTDSLHRPKIVDEQTIRDARACAKAALEERNRNLENAWKTL